MGCQMLLVILYIGQALKKGKARGLLSDARNTVQLRQWSLLFLLLLSLPAPYLGNHLLPLPSDL